MVRGAAKVCKVLLQSHGGRARRLKGVTLWVVHYLDLDLVGEVEREELSPPPLAPSGMAHVLLAVCCADAHTVPQSPPCISLFQHISMLQN